MPVALTLSTVLHMTTDGIRGVTLDPHVQPCLLHWERHTQLSQAFVLTFCGTPSTLAVFVIFFREPEAAAVKDIVPVG